MTIASIAMILTIALSNFLVQFPINEWLTWGAFSYPLSFLITELTNRFFGPKKAKRIVYLGFFFALVISFWISTAKIAIASVSAFLASQCTDLYLFNRLRENKWWHAPFFASLGASIVDTACFWPIAFYGDPVPLLTWALGDFGVKIGMDFVFLFPFRLAVQIKNFQLQTVKSSESFEHRSC